MQEMDSEIFVTDPGHIITYKPVIYGIYLGDGWFALDDGTIFYTFYREIAAATLHGLHKGTTSRIAIIGGDGQPELLE